MPDDWAIPMGAQVTVEAERRKREEADRAATPRPPRLRKPWHEQKPPALHGRDK